MDGKPAPLPAVSPWEDAALIIGQQLQRLDAPFHIRADVGETIWAAVDRARALSDHQHQQEIAHLHKCEQTLAGSRASWARRAEAAEYALTEIQRLQHADAVICLHGHRSIREKDDHWPVRCLACGAAAAPESWWAENPHGPILIAMQPDTLESLREENAKLRMALDDLERQNNDKANLLLSLAGEAAPKVAP